MSERGMLAFQSTRNKKWRGRSPDILFSLTPSTFGGMSERSEDNPYNNRKTKIYLLCREWSERSEDNPCNNRKTKIYLLCREWSERSEDNPYNNRKTKIYLLCREWSERSEDNPLINRMIKRPKKQQSNQKWQRSCNTLNI